MNLQADPPAPDGWLACWKVDPAAGKEYEVLDGLRGVAILLVVMCHLLRLDPNGGAITQLWGGMVAAGTWGVTIFFALSGFLISDRFWKRKVEGAAQLVPERYAARRFWKIYP